MGMDFHIYIADWQKPQEDSKDPRDKHWYECLEEIYYARKFWALWYTIKERYNDANSYDYIEIDKDDIHALIETAIEEPNYFGEYRVDELVYIYHNYDDWIDEGKFIYVECDW